MDKEIDYSSSYNFQKDFLILTSLDWNSLVIAKNVSVASVVPICSPWNDIGIDDSTIDNKSVELAMTKLDLHNQMKHPAL